MPAASAAIKAAHHLIMATKPVLLIDQDRIPSSLTNHLDEWRRIEREPCIEKNSTLAAARQSGLSS
jgi:hypothetical protein